MTKPDGKSVFVSLSFLRWLMLACAVAAYMYAALNLFEDFGEIEPRRLAMYLALMAVVGACCSAWGFLSRRGVAR
jgi:hypothetical protein